MAGNKCSWRRKLTAEKAEEIANLLRNNAHMTVNSASAAVGLPGNLVRQTLSRLERGECPSELDENIALTIVAGLQAQLDQHRQSAEVGSVEGNATLVNWKKWRLETAAPLEHAKVSKQELSGPDEGPIETVDLTRLPFAAVLQLASGEPGEGEN